MKAKSIESNDPAFHREHLRLWRAEVTERDPESGSNANIFVDKLLDVFTDNPLFSWRFRITTYKNPIFRVHNVKSGRGNDFLLVGTREIIILKKFFDVRFRHLFPRSSVFYGSGVGSGVNVFHQGVENQKEYIEAARSMAQNSPDWYIRTL